MTEEMRQEMIRKQQLMQLQNELSSIENQINSFKTNLQNLKIEIKKHLIVDNLIVEEETYNRVANNTNSINSNISQAKSIVASKL